jgi:hypothetical protein
MSSIVLCFCGSAKVCASQPESISQDLMSVCPLGCSYQTMLLSAAQPVPDFDGLLLQGANVFADVPLFYGPFSNNGHPKFQFSGNM